PGFRHIANATRLRRPSTAQNPRRGHRSAETRDYLRRRRVRLSVHAERFPVVLRQGGVDEVSRSTRRTAHQRALSLEWTSLHIPAEATEVSRSARTSHGPA